MFALPPPRALRAGRRISHIFRRSRLRHAERKSMRVCVIARTGAEFLHLGRWDDCPASECRDRAADADVHASDLARPALHMVSVLSPAKSNVDDVAFDSLARRNDSTASREPTTHGEKQPSRQFVHHCRRYAQHELHHCHCRISRAPAHESCETPGAGDRRSGTGRVLRFLTKDRDLLSTVSLPTADQDSKLTEAPSITIISHSPQASGVVQYSIVSKSNTMRPSRSAREFASTAGLARRLTNARTISASTGD